MLIIHEGAHGIVATLERIKIKTGGFAVFVAMFAGFVEPDEKEFDNAKKNYQNCASSVWCHASC